MIPLELFQVISGSPKIAAKPLAFWVVLGALLIGWGMLGALLGRVALTRRPGPAMLRVWLAAMGFLALVALAPAVAYYSAFLSAEGAVIRHSVVVLHLLAAIAGYGLLFAVPYTLVVRLIPRDVTADPTDPEAAAELTRRELLTRAIIVIAAAAAGTLAVQWTRGLLRPVVAFGQSLFARVKELPPEVTPNEQFYVVSKNPPGFDPTVDVNKWSLEVGGLVARPRRFTYAELRALPAVEQMQTLECISNEVGGNLISTALWRGVRLLDVLLAAGGATPTALRVAFRCADGYSEAHPMDDALNPTTILAYDMNGERLPPAHGFPLRLLVPGLYGMKNPKWITKIEVVSTDFQGYWEAAGWSDEAVVKTMSSFTTLTPTHRLGEVPLGGVAYGGDRGIQGVEYSTDDGKRWKRADVKPAGGPFTWVLWAALWTPTAAGEYRLKVRAQDAKGTVQVSREVPTLPDGASGYHTLRLRIIK